MNSKIVDFFSNLTKWQDELLALRNICLKLPLSEEFKWKHPCYSFTGHNIVLIHGFKEYCAITFFKGALINDIDNLLIAPTEKVNSSRQIRFRSMDEILRQNRKIQKYIKEAIDIEQKGLKVIPKSIEEYHIPEELTIAFVQDQMLKEAFDKLTPGKQRGYLLFFSEPKLSQTKTDRIAKYRTKILQGKGMNDCICGLSKRKPNCDGSHKLRNRTYE